MESEIMDIMDTGSDSAHYSDDEILLIAATPPTPKSINCTEDSSKSGTPKCNFNVVIDIEEDSETADDTGDNLMVDNRDDETRNNEVYSQDSLIPASICSDHKESGSDTDFEESVDAVVTDTESFDIISTSDSQPISNEVKTPEEAEELEELEFKRIMGTEIIPNKPESILEKHQRERSLLEQQMKDRDPERQLQLGRLKRLMPADKIFPSVRPSNYHTICFVLTTDYRSGDALKPFPNFFTDKWDVDYVRMPCSDRNTRVSKVLVGQNNEEDNGESSKVYEERVYCVWELVEDALNRPMLTSRDIESSIKQYFKTTRKFVALNYAIENIMSNTERENFFAKVLPAMQQLCLELKKTVTCPIPLLCKFMNYSISLSQKQIACLLANAFFSTFPSRVDSDFPSINFVDLFVEDDTDRRKLIVKAHKIRCILHYFERIVEEMPRGVVTYTRKSVRNSKAPDWKNSTKKLTNIVALLDGTIETDGAGFLGVDFANKIIGGGVMGRGAVQEEILFVIYPELLLTRLFTEKLSSCEAVLITGCERFSEYKGYSNSFEYAGDFYDCTQWDCSGRKCTQFVAIDALYISRPVTQFDPRYLKRELDKAYVGFSSPNGTTVAIASGKWGCGAFNGNAQLKSVLQLLAASYAARDIVLFTFGDVYLLRDIENMYEIIKDMTIQEVWNLLENYNQLCCTSNVPTHSLQEFLTEFVVEGKLTKPLSEDVSVSKPDKNEQSTSRTFKQIPIDKFYFNKDKPRTISKVTEVDKRESNTHNNTPKVTRVEDFAQRPDNNDSWLNTLESVKSSMKPKPKISNSMKNDHITKSSVHDKNVPLNEDQIADILEEEMDIEEPELKAVKRCKSSNSSQNNSPSVERKSIPFLRMGKSASSPSSISEERSSASPKPKKQMTLTDFFR